MKLTINGQEYVVRFAHDVLDKYTTASLHEIQKNEQGKVTVDEDTQFVGEAMCHYRDQFTKKTGRKVAFTRLLELMSKNRFMLTKEDRQEIWKQYFEQFKV